MKKAVKRGGGDVDVVQKEGKCVCGGGRCVGRRGDVVWGGGEM